MGRIGILCIATLMIMSCEKGHRTDCFVSYGEQRTEDRQIETFMEVMITTDVDVTFIRDTANWVTAISGEELVTGLVSEVTDGVLHLNDGNRCHWMRDYGNRNELEVHYTEFKRIHFEGTGDVKFKNAFLSDTLIIDCWNAGGSINLRVNNAATHLNIHTLSTDITAQGFVSNLYLYEAGNGYIYAQDIEAHNVFVTHGGEGDFYVNCKNLLDVQLNGDGNVYYQGNPLTIKLTENENARGAVIDLTE